MSRDIFTLEFDYAAPAVPGWADVDQVDKRAQRGRDPYNHGLSSRAKFV